MQFIIAHQAHWSLSLGVQEAAGKLAQPRPFSREQPLCGAEQDSHGPSLSVPWQTSTPVGPKKDMPSESCELGFIWGKMRTAARETAPRIALRDCSEKTVGEGQYRRFWLRGSSAQSSVYFTEGFLLVMRGWCHHEGI